MSLTQIYSNQYRWRRWSSVYPHLGDLSGKQVLDLGCGIGDQARDLSRLGADIVGVDANQEFIDHAKSRGIPNARFLCGNIADLKDNLSESDGVWASFTVAYSPRFDVFLRSIDSALKSGGWLAITEVDDLFGHAPLDSHWATLIEKYYARSLEDAVYRFRSHDHVCEFLTERGWNIEVDRTLEDDEFCFAGPASPEIVEAWRTRLDFMMPRFLERFGNDAVGFDSAFLQCLASDKHRSRSSVWFVLARSPTSP
jgi:SAM-dependent methyltransferase